MIKEPPAAQGGDLGHMEFSALCIVFENQDSDDSFVSAWSITNDMERLGYTKLATKIALARLVEQGLVSVQSFENEHGEGSYSAYGMHYTGAAYIMKNADKLETSQKEQGRAAFGESEHAWTRCANDRRGSDRRRHPVLGVNPRAVL